MHVIRLAATAGPDGVLRLAVPVGDAGDYDLVITASPAAATASKKGGPRGTNPGDLGWTAGVGEDAGMSIDDTLFGGLDADKKPDALGGFS